MVARWIPVFFMAFASACGTQSVDVAQTSLDSNALASSKRSIPSENEIYNFHTVHSFMFRSGRPEGDQEFDLIQSLGIKTVLDLETEDSSNRVAQERSEIESRGLNFISQPWHPSSKPTLAQIYRALDTIRDPNLHPVLIHCKYGKDRTGILVASHRIRYENWSESKAREELRDYGHMPHLWWWDDILGDVEPAHE